MACIVQMPTMMHGRRDIFLQKDSTYTPGRMGSGNGPDVLNQSGFRFSEY